MGDLHCQGQIEGGELRQIVGDLFYRRRNEREGRDAEEGESTIVYRPREVSLSYLLISFFFMCVY